MCSRKQNRQAKAAIEAEAEAKAAPAAEGAVEDAAEPREAAGELGNYGRMMMVWFFL
jgi:hypothetical protein